MTTLLVWILIVGESGGRNSATQMGPFAKIEDCRLAANSAAIKTFDKQCVQVNMVFAK